MLVGKVRVVLGRLRNLQDFAAQVRHRNAALDGACLVDGVLEQNVRIPRLKLDLSQRLEEPAGRNLLLLDLGVIHHLVILLRHRNLGKRHPVDPLHVIRAEEIHVLILLRQVERNVGDDYAKREGLDADLLIRVFPLRVQERHDVGVVGVKVHRPRALASTQLVSVREGILQQLHDWDNSGGLVLNPLDGCSSLTKVSERQRHPSPTLRELKRGVDATSDGLHIVLDPEQETGDQFSACDLACVQEGRGRGLEPARHHFVHQVAGKLNVSTRQIQRHNDNPVFKTFQVAGAVESFQGVRGVVLKRPQESGETELVGVRLLVKILDVLERVLVQHLLFVVPLIHQILELLFKIVEEDRVFVDVGQEVLTSRLTVRVELDLPVRVVEIQLRIQGMVIKIRGEGLLLAGIGQRLDQNSLSPSCTRVTSWVVPRSSNL